MAGNALTAAQLNVDVRDNENALSTHGHGGAAGDGALALSNHKVVTKTVAQAASATGLSSDNAFSFAITGTASEVWAVDIHAHVAAGGGATSTNTFKFKWNVPASAAVQTQGIFTMLPLNTSGLGNVGAYINGTASGSMQTFAGTLASGFLWDFHAVIAAQGTSGTVQFLWGIGTAYAAGWTMTSGSYLVAHRLQ